jgi:hypothetical protein
MHANTAVDAEYREAIEKQSRSNREDSWRILRQSRRERPALTVNLATGIVNLVESAPFKAIVKDLTQS